MRKLRPTPILLGFSFIFCSCGDPDVLVGTDPYQDYEEENVTVLGGSPDTPIASGALPEGENCLQITTDTCTPVNREGKYCKEGDGPTDVIVLGGEVVEVVCYEDSDSTNGPTVVVDSDNDGDLDIPQQDNGAVMTFDEGSNGTPIEGNITIDGNNVTLYGNGPDNTIINGNLLITGNNARVRGIRVTGNVTIDLNTAAFVLSVVEGDLIVESNNSLVAENDVFGNVVINGNNSILVGNDVKGDWQLNGSDARCESNHKFADENEDMIVQPEERGDALPCS